MPTVNLPCSGSNLEYPPMGRYEGVMEDGFHTTTGTAMIIISEILAKNLSAHAFVLKF